jgi:hypothetical protein
MSKNYEREVWTGLYDSQDIGVAFSTRQLMLPISLEAGRNALQQFNSLITKRSTSRYARRKVNLVDDNQTDQCRSQSATPPPQEESSIGPVHLVEMPATEQWSKR